MKDFFGYIISGLISTIIVWSSINYVFDQKIPLKTSYLVVGTIASPFATLAAICFISADVVKLISTFNGCIANCSK